MSRNVKCDLRNAIQIYLLLKLFVTIRFRDHAWSSHRQFFWLFSLVFDEWRMSILDYRVTYVCSWFFERCLWWDVIKLDKTFYQTLCERFIKFDESDLSNLMNENVILLNLTKAINQNWLRHLIKLDDVISLNFWKEKQSFYFLMSSFLQRHLIWRTKSCKELSFCAKINEFVWDCYDKWAFLMKTERWYNSTFFYIKRKASSYFKIINEWLSFRQFELLICQKYMW